MTETFATKTSPATIEANPTVTAQTGQLTPEVASQWINLAPSLTSAFSTILNAFKRPDITDMEREMAIQQEFYSLQNRQAQTQQKTYLVAGAVCIAAIIVPVLITRKG